MGRPVNKRFFGNPATKAGDQFYVQGWFSGSIAGAEEQCFIVKQTGTRTFLVESVANSDQGEVRLVDFSLGAISAGQGYIESRESGLYDVIVGQDETFFDNTPATEGTFAGGTGHANADVITVTGGATVRVDLVAAGVVTQFTILTAGTAGFASATATLSQTATTGAGAGFSLTMDTDNLDQFGEEYVRKLSNKNIQTFSGEKRKAPTFAVGGVGSETTPSVEGE